MQVVRFGGPEVLVPGETRIRWPDRVRSCSTWRWGITFVETQIRRGTGQWHERPPSPYVPGSLVAGRVSEAGARVDPAWLGRRVLAGTADTGGFAERAVVAAGELFPVPDGLGLPEATALYSDGAGAGRQRQDRPG